MWCRTHCLGCLDSIKKAKTRPTIGINMPQRPARIGTTNKKITPSVPVDTILGISNEGHATDTEEFSKQTWEKLQMSFEVAGRN